METDAGQPIVHALLVCRDVESGERGEISLQNVVEILPVESFPGEVGPLNFVAFVRNLPPGPGEGAFVLRTPGSEQPLGRLPLEVDIPQGYGGRQVALQVRVPTLPVNSGGWFHVLFEWNGAVLAVNQFAVGATGADGAVE